MTKAKLRQSRSATIALAVSSTLAAYDAMAADAPSTDNSSHETVVVTGSRIQKNGFDEPTPTVSIPADAIEMSGKTNLTDFLTNQPALVGSLDATQTTGSAGFIGSTGLNLLDLRNLGTNRTLVLVDGRRHVAQLPESASVDINTIPEDLVERVDIVTGGVSAVYGADAVSGVVNFIMKKDFEGLKARMQYGSASGGAPQDWHGSVTGGFNFAEGRGNLSGSIEHTVEGRLRATDRSYLHGTGYKTLHENPDDPNDDPKIPDFVPLNNVRFFDSSREGGIDLDFDGVPDIRPNGQPYAIDKFIPPFYTQGGTGTLQGDYIGDLISKNQTTVTSAFLNFKLADHANLFAEAKYVYGKAFSAAQPTFDYYLFMQPDNPFIPAAVASQIDPANGGFLLNRDNFDLGVRAEDITRKTARTVFGVNGDFSDGYHYEVSYVFGESKIHSIATNNRYNDRFQAALDVVTNPANGQPTCRSNLDPTAMPFQPFHNFDISQFWPNNLSFTPGPNSGCLPLNLLGEGVANPAAIDWIFTNSLTQSKLTQNVFNAFVSGPIPGIHLPAGPIDAVAGIEWRRETSRTDTPPEDQAGLTFGNVIFPTDGNFDVKEAFAEIRVPLLKDLPFAEVLQVSGAVRVSDYSTVGHTTTWNVGSIWSPVRDVTFRTTVAQSVRAPDISELFSPDSQTFLFINDPCDITHLNEGTSFRRANCTAILQSLGIDPTTYTDPNSSNISGNQHGNSKLTEETARSYTYGAVFRPRFLSGLAISIDYYDINIKHAINTATAQQVADNCVDQPTIDNVFCDALTRDNTTGGIDGFTVQPENVASFRTRGIDFNANYTIDPANLGIKRPIGLFSVNLVGNRLDRLTTVPTPGAEQIDNRTTQFAPKWQAQLTLSWQLGGFRANYGYNYFSPTTRFTLNTLAGEPDEASHADIFFNSRHTHDVTFAYDFANAYRIYAGVNNLTDQRPDLDTGYPVSPVGRFFFAGLKVDFGAMR